MFILRFACFVQNVAGQESKMARAFTLMWSGRKKSPAPSGAAPIRKGDSIEIPMSRLRRRKENRRHDRVAAAFRSRLLASAPAALGLAIAFVAAGLLRPPAAGAQGTPWSPRAIPSDRARSGSIGLVQPPRPRSHHLHRVHIHIELQSTTSRPLFQDIQRALDRLSSCVGLS